MIDFVTLKVCRVLVLCLASVAIGAVCGEVLLRFLPYPPSTVGWHEPAILPRELNELGFRGQSIRYGRGDFVVVLLGDSQVECMACDFEELPESQLEHALADIVSQPKVFTVGSGGYGNDQELLHLERYLERFRADLVVHWLTPINDVWNNLFPTHWPGHRDGTEKPTFRLAAGGALVGPHAPLGRRPGGEFLALLAKARRGCLDCAWERFLPPRQPGNTTSRHRLRVAGLRRDENPAGTHRAAQREHDRELPAVWERSRTVRHDTMAWR